MIAFIKRHATYALEELSLYGVRSGAARLSAEAVTDLALWTVRALNRGKDRCLAGRLERLARYYDPRGGW